MTETFIQRLEAPFEDLFARIKADVVAAIPKAEQVAVDAEQGAINALGAVFSVGYPYARDAVIAEAPKLISGQEKFGNAVTNVAQKLEVELGPIVIAHIQVLVEIVFQGLKRILGAKT